MTSPHGKGMREQAGPSVCSSIRPSVMLLASLATSVGICYGAPSTAHSSLYFQVEFLYTLLT